MSPGVMLARDRRGSRGAGSRFRGTAVTWPHHARGIDWIGWWSGRSRGPLFRCRAFCKAHGGRSCTLRAGHAGHHDHTGMQP